MRKNLLVAFLLIGVPICRFALTNESLADEPIEADPAKAEIQHATELTSAEMELWRFRLAKEPGLELKFVKTPILRWTNPTVGRVYGNVHVVTGDGRPLVITSPFKWYHPYRSLEVECASLATSGIEATRDGKTVWSTSSPGLEWKTVPEGPVVGKSAVERQRQMKQLAAKFTAELVDTRSNTKGEDQQLRQMTQPIYRYECPKNQILDGGIFAYVVGTDPEFFLLLEAVENQEASRWYYGLARMNSDRLTVKFENQEVQAIKKLSYELYRDQKQPYFAHLVSEK